MKMKSKFPAFLIVLVVAVRSVWGSEASVFKFRTLGVDVPPMEFELVARGKTTKVPVLPDTRSEVFSHKGSPSVVLRQIPGGATYSAGLPASGGPFLLVWTKADDGGACLRVVDESPGVFPAGSTCVLNASAKALGASIGGQRFELPGGEMRIVPPPSPACRTQVFQVFRDEAGGAEAAFSNNWAVTPSLRTLVVIQDSGGAVAVRRFTEMVVPPTR